MNRVERPLKFSRFGAGNSERIVVYFHGAPGAPEECAVFDRYGKQSGLMFICFDRFSIDPSITGDAYYRLLAEAISRQAAGRNVAFVGFSIGAFIALQTCRCMPAAQVRSLHLVSAAAPLEAGDFLDDMAGKRVFQLAAACPALLAPLSYWQGLLARLFPDALFRLLFASASGKDRILAADREFQSDITQALKSCFIGRARGYARDIGAYVRPWQAILPEIAINTHIWHGAEDNWSPKLMAEYLASVIPGCSHIEILEGLSHYSCLYDAIPGICHQLRKSSGFG